MLPQLLASFAMEPPSEIRSGCNRLPIDTCLISANDDTRAIQIWLERYSHKKTTFNSYQKEVERLLLWGVIQKHRSISSLTTDDFRDYFNFLACPEPREFWCASGNSNCHKRGSKGWKPFIGPLSNSSITTAKTILNSMMEFLVTARYLRANPIPLLRIANSNFSMAATKNRALTRLLQPDEWQAIQNTLTSLPANNPYEKGEKARLVFIVSMLYLTGIRVSELASCTWDRFVEIDSRWWLLVTGKGDKEGMVPVNKSLLQAIIRFREQQGMQAMPISGETGYVVPSWRSGKALTPNYIAKLLKRLACLAAEGFRDDIPKYNKLRKFSPHWLRHLSASMQSRAGIPFDNIKDNLRHAKRETTQIYVHSLDNQRHDAMQLLELELPEG